MNTRRNVTRRLVEVIAIAGAPPLGNKVPPLEEDVNDDHAPVNPPPLIDGDIRDDLLNMSQAFTTQAQAVTTQAQAMMTKDNRVVVP